MKRVGLGSLAFALLVAISSATPVFGAASWRVHVDDGTAGESIPQPASGTAVPTEILPRPREAPVSFDRCLVHEGPDGVLTTDIYLTNTSVEEVRRVDVRFVVDGASGSVRTHSEWRGGHFAPGAVIWGSIRFVGSDASYAKAYCTLRRVIFTDGSVWLAPPLPSPAPAPTTSPR
ncbi:MAG TPA: hypothetical protein VFB22_13565 [Candidatus Baltobacteraceae bacterium]|nr:hypothetical protein [Candidatus Baltobacteraceae bacterium]